MITARNEFETIPAFTHIAGCSLGTWTDRETTCAMLKVLDLTTNYDTRQLWRDVAECVDEDGQFWYETQQEIADLITENSPIADYCTVSLNDGEWQVIPYVDDELTVVDDIPDTLSDEFLLLVNDHGNTSLLHYEHGACRYQSVWAMV